MPYTIIDAKDAPPPAKKRNAAAREAESIVRKLSKGTVAQLEPEGSQTLRGLRVLLGRAAKNAGVKIQTWDVDGYLYVKLAG